MDGGKRPADVASSGFARKRHKTDPNPPNPDDVTEEVSNFIENFVTVNLIFNF